MDITQQKIMDMDLYQNVVSNLNVYERNYLKHLQGKNLRRNKLLRRKYIDWK